MKRKSRRERAVAKLLPRVYEAEEDPRGLAESLGLSLGDLAEWADRRSTAGALGGLRRLADVQTQLIVSRYRRTAAAKLLALANQEQSDELARKACVDLLKTDLVPADPAPAPAGSGEPDDAIDPEGVVEALERMGRGGG